MSEKYIYSHQLEARDWVQKEDMTLRELKEIDQQNNNWHHLIHFTSINANYSFVTDSQTEDLLLIFD